MFTIEAILEDDLRDANVKSRKVVVATIANKKKLTAIISFLNQVVPLSQSSLSHLKRINSKTNQCQVIIVPTVGDTVGDEVDLIANSLKPLGDQLKYFLHENELNQLAIRDVASKLPLTRPQFERASLLWPVNFHEDKYISKCLDGTLFTPDHMKRIFSLMSETLSLASSHSNGLYISSSPHKSCHSMAAIIVKNNGQFKVTRAVSETATSPLNHAAMVAIDNVASIHRKVKDNAVNEEAGDSADLAHYEDDYLCTNYECFLSQDPCIMCAMALVHSRIKRVFIYGPPNSEQLADDCNDQAYQMHKLHILPNLNHHYEVWKLSPLESPCSTDQIEFPNKKAKCDGR